MSEHWVVVGAGSAGCVVAARLAERDGIEVTLVEAGPDLAPGSVPEAIAGPDFLAALAVPGRVHDGLTARRRPGADATPYARGRGVGGSSAVNSMIGLRGDPAQYRRWGWLDADEAWERVRIPVERPGADELGVVDRALLAAAPDAEPAPLTRAGGRRITSADAYLVPQRHRPDLTVLADAPVDRVVIDGRQAVGIRLVDGSELAADHVVLAAGAIHSPAILLRSGVDTPGVGEGLQDHPAAPVTLVLRDRPARPAADGTARTAQLVIGSLLGRGDLQVVPMNRLGDGAGSDELGLLMVALMRPQGRNGAVRLVSDDPLVHPAVEFDLLGHPADLAGMRRGVELLVDLLATDAFGEVVERAVIDEHGTPVDVLTDGDRVDRWLRSSSGEYVHAACSCRMGTVVDGDGAVAGYRSLYVCDASVFPEIPVVNPHLPTTMLAERLSARWTAR